jgi:hypothetical protein
VRPLLFGLLGLLLCALTLVLGAHPARADDTHDSILSTPADVFVSVQSVTGSVHVLGTARREVKVHMADGVSMTSSDGGAHVSISVRPGGPDPVEVSVPAAARVEVHAISADVSVRDVTGPVQAGSVNGNVEVSGGARDVEARSVSGNVTLSLARADVRATSVNGTVTVRLPGGGTAWVKTVSGSTQIIGAPLTRLEVQTISGAVTLEPRLEGSGPFSVRTHSGPIDVTLPKGASTSVDARSFRGHIDVPDAPDAAAAPAASHTVLSVSTFSGPIDVKRK